MKKILSLVVTVTLVMSLFTATAFAGQENGQGKLKEFKDMKGHWGSKSVQKMQSLGILGGYTDGTFQPDKALTQAELAVMIERLLEKRQNLEEDDEDAIIDEDDAIIDEDEDDDEDLSDVPAWAKEAVQKGFQKQYFNLKRFRSHVQCDRLTACVAIAKALELEPVTDFTGNPFKDRGLISEEDYGYILALYKAGFIKGYPNGNFNPNALLSRAQMASIIEKLLDKETEELEDQTAPAWSSDSTVTATAISANSVKLVWTGAGDDGKVVEYKISYEINDVRKVKYVTTRTAEISGLEPDEEYTFTIEAKDAAGNWSDDGPSVEVTTLEAEEEDATNPTWPSGSALTISPSAPGIVTLIWPDAEDNVGVDAYKIYQDGELVKTLDGDANNTIVTGLKEDTEYTFKIRAIDEAGNRSAGLVKAYLTE